MCSNIFEKIIVIGAELIVWDFNIKFCLFIQSEPKVMSKLGHY
jgi:hypothetical protein